MLRVFRPSLAAAAFAVAFTACSEDPLGTNSGDPLSPDEIQAVFDAFALAFSSLGSTAQLVSSQGGPAAVSVTETLNTSATCPEGGSIGAGGSVSGTFDDETFAADLSFQLTVSPNSCVVSTNSGAITVDGDPNVRILMDWTSSETQLSLSGSERGGIRFTSNDGRSGSCAIDVDFSSTVNLTTSAGSGSVTGTICGVSAEQFETFGAGEISPAQAR